MGAKRNKIKTDNNNNKRNMTVIQNSRPGTVVAVFVSAFGKDITFADEQTHIVAV